MLIHEGKTVTISGQDYVVPGLSLRMVRKVVEGLDTLQNGTRLQQLDFMLDIIHGAMSRNYPELSKDSLEDLLDASSVGPVFQAIMVQSGLGQDQDPKAIAAP